MRKNVFYFRQRPTTNPMQGYDSDDEQSVKAMHHNKLADKDKNESNTSSSILVLPSVSSPLSPPASLTVRRRNVNWNLSSHESNNSSPNVEGIENVEEPQPLRQRRGFNNPLAMRSTEDDGFESLTGKSSSGDEVRQNGNNKPSDSDTETLKNSTPVKLNKNEIGSKRRRKESTDSEFEENDDVDSLTPTSSSNHQFETTDIGVTSNSESECADDDANYTNDDDDDNVPAKILNPNDSSEKVSVTLWTKHEAKKAEMSILEISSAIIQRVDLLPETYDYVFIGAALSCVVCMTPIYCRLCDVTKEHHNSTSNLRVIDDTFTFSTFMQLSFGQTSWENIILVIATFQRLVLAFCFFFLLAVAERTFKQRYVLLHH
jgi:hypothetical protein